MADKDEDFIAKAKEWHKLAQERYSENRARQREDVRFAAASPDDPWQWDERDRKARQLSARPALTINKLPQHIRQVTNDIRMNRPAIRYRPADSKADVESADILMGIARHIEAHSNADVAYDCAADNQVTHGEGFIRVLTEYVNEKSFDQEIVIAAVPNPFRVHLDPNREDPVGSDARWCIVDDEMGDDEFERQYPDAEPIDWQADIDGNWFTSQKKVLVAEVFYLENKEATLLMWANGETSFKGDPVPQGVFMGERPVKERKSHRVKLMWRKINGKEILEEREFPCSFIPFARVVGNEWIVDGKRYWSGLVRNAKDSQRMYNIAQSAIVERVMQAPKAPWTIPAEAVESHEKTWQTANTANHAYLPWNHLDADGNPIPGPERNQPTVVEAGLQQVAMGASDDIKAETGQYDASLGARGNETSGRAIMARQREGDTATYHYVDNLGRAVRHIGRIVLDMIPKIYDTQRIARILGEDGDIANVTIDPQAPQALAKVKDDRGEIQRIFNPNIGLYDVYVSTGPSFSTRRVEAVEAMTQMVQANPQLMQVIGDQLVKNMDWPGADEMAERLKLTLMPQIQEKLAGEEGGEEQMPPQAKMALAQMQQQVQTLDQAIQGMQAELEQTQDKQRQAELKAQMEESKRIKAETENYVLKAKEQIAAEQQQAIQAVQSVMPPPPPEQEEQMEDNTGPLIEALLTSMQQMADRQAQAMEQQAQANEQLMAAIQMSAQATVDAVSGVEQSIVRAQTAPKTATLSNGRQIRISTDGFGDMNG